MALGNDCLPKPHLCLVRETAGWLLQNCSVFLPSHLLSVQWSLMLALCALARKHMIRKFPFHKAEWTGVWGEEWPSSSWDWRLCEETVTPFQTASTAAKAVGWSSGVLLDFSLSSSIRSISTSYQSNLQHVPWIQWHQSHSRNHPDSCSSGSEGLCSLWPALLTLPLLLLLDPNADNSFSWPAALTPSMGLTLSCPSICYYYYYYYYYF